MSKNREILAKLAIFRESLASPTQLQWDAAKRFEIDEILAFLCENRVSLRVSPQAREICMLCCEKFDGNLANSCVKLTDCACLQAVHKDCLRAAAFSRLSPMKSQEIRCFSCGNAVSPRVFREVFEENVIDAVFAEIDRVESAKSLRTPWKSLETAQTPAISLRNPSKGLETAQTPAISLGTPWETMRTPAIFECSVCFQRLSVDEDCVTLDCEHRYCGDCLRNYVKEQISSNKVKKTEICCFSCRQPLTIFQIQYVLNFQEFKEFQRKSIAFDPSFLAEDETLVKCPAGNCDNQVIISKENAVSHHQCEACGLVFCVRGCEKPHVGLSCEENRRKSKENAEDRLLEEKIRSEGWRKCPKCQAVVEKNQGCNHMTCRCGAEFCYVCGAQPGKACHKEGLLRRVLGFLN